VASICGAQITSCACTNVVLVGTMHVHVPIHRYYGLFLIKTGTRCQRLVVMENVFHGHGGDVERHDLKGSKLGRSIGIQNRGSQMVHKDLDFIEMYGRLPLDTNLAKMLMAQMKEDVRLLRTYDVLDYSLLVGIHHAEHSDQELRWQKQNQEMLRDLYQHMHQRCIDRASFQTFVQFCLRHSSSVGGAVPRLKDTQKQGPRGSDLSLDDNELSDAEVMNRLRQPCRRGHSEFQRYNGGVGSVVVQDGKAYEGRQRFHFAIIDHLIPFEWKKQAEYAAKLAFHGRSGGFSGGDKNNVRD